MKKILILFAGVLLANNVLANIIINNQCAASGYVSLKSNCQKTEYTEPLNAGGYANLIALNNKECVYKVAFVSNKGVKTCTVPGLSNIAFDAKDCKCRPN